MNLRVGTHSLVRYTDVSSATNSNTVLHYIVHMHQRISNHTNVLYMHENLIVHSPVTSDVLYAEISRAIPLVYSKLRGSLSRQ